VASPPRQKIETAKRGLGAAGEMQAAFDALAWQVSEPLAKLRHVILHMNKALGEIAAVAEHLDHQRDSGEPVTHADVGAGIAAAEHRLADLVMFASQLANLSGRDLGVIWTARMQSILERRASDSDLLGAFLQEKYSEQG
jgi:hypothetical protein